MEEYRGACSDGGDEQDDDSGDVAENVVALYGQMKEGEAVDLEVSGCVDVTGNTIHPRLPTETDKARYSAGSL